MTEVRFLLPYQARTRGRRVAVAILATTLGLSVWGCRATGQLAAAGPATLQSSPRATADCPDDSDLPQIHLLYAIPSDGTDLELDKNGLIRASVASAQSWLAKESGGSRLRFDTCQGDLDATFVNQGELPVCFAKDCAPGHVRKPRRDLMSAPKWKFPSRLDVGKDDYWGHSKVGLVDVSQSAFLDPTPTNYALPPIWPPSVATAIPASQEPTLRSPSTSEKVKLQIVNRSGSVLHVHWLNHSGAREPHGQIPVDRAIPLDTLQGHLWVVADDQGKALAIYRAPDKGRRHRPGLGRPADRRIGGAHSTEKRT